MVYCHMARGLPMTLTFLNGWKNNKRLIGGDARELHEIQISLSVSEVLPEHSHTRWSTHCLWLPLQGTAVSGGGHGIQGICYLALDRSSQPTSVSEQPSIETRNQAQRTDPAFSRSATGRPERPCPEVLSLGSLQDVTLAAGRNTSPSARIKMT